MRAYLMKHGVALATVGIAGFVVLLASGAVWGIVILKVYVRLWSPYIDDYKAAARMGDPLLLGGRVSVGTATFHCEVIVMMMAPWALTAARCFFGYLELVDDFLACSLNNSFPAE
jgi:hypothetical protein